MPLIPAEHLAGALEAFPDARRCWVALSGGLDSQVLLHAVAAVRNRFRFALRAIHVDHGLHPDSAQWAVFCGGRCDDLGVPLTVARLTLTRKRGESLEAAAREARYRALRQALGGGDLLLTAQHRDDQAETLLLALMRGSGVRGLAAMPAVARLGDAWLVRPLLDFSRASLIAYAREQGLAWLEDPANTDLSFDRVFLRTRVLPLLADRWPGASAALARSAAHCAEAQALIEEAAGQELARVRGSRRGSLSVGRLAGVDPARAKAVLRHWIAGLGLPCPDSRRLERIRREVLGARADRSPLVAWPGCEVRRYRDDLFAMPPLPEPAAPPLEWHRGALTLPGGLGRLVLTGDAGGMVEPDAVWPEGLRVRFAVTGASCRPGRGMPLRRLKQLYQEAGVPPWLRPYVPLLYAGGGLFAVGDFWRCSRMISSRAPVVRVRWEGGLRAHPAFPARSPAGLHTDQEGLKASARR